MRKSKYFETLKLFQKGNQKEKETKQEIQTTKKLAKELIDKFTKKEKRDNEELRTDFTKSSERMKKEEDIIKRCQKDETAPKIERNSKKKKTIKLFEEEVAVKEDIEDLSKIEPDENFQCEFSVAEPELEAVLL